jgi:hypothetical protein
MKKTMLSFTLFTLLLAMVACGGSSNSGNTANNLTSLSLQDELLIGTFKLEDSTLAVNPNQASLLIPLWETMQSLTTSGTAATEEINAVVTQIRDTMTSQQINAIAAMELTQQDLVSTMTENGLASKDFGTSSPSDASSIQGPMGDVSAGAAGDQGLGIPSGTGDTSAMASGSSTGQTQAASSQTSSSQLQVSYGQDSTSLLSALIKLLQKKVQS